MLLREDGESVLCIGQASHAWMSGQLARAWAGDLGPRREEVLLAAEQHDVGWSAWDLAPSLDPATGRPHSFLSLPFAERVALWRDAPRRLLSQSVYAALLVSLHGTRLQAGDERAAGYLREQAALQHEWSRETGADPAELRRHRDLVAEWDRLSLALCLRWEPFDAGQPFALSPWPLAADSLEVRCEGRRLAGRFAAEAELHAALRAAPPETLRFRLAARAPDPGRS